MEQLIEYNMSNLCTCIYGRRLNGEIKLNKDRIMLIESLPCNNLYFDTNTYKNYIQLIERAFSITALSRVFTTFVSLFYKESESSL
ncbi:hypothetical protein BLD50_00835 [Bacillus cereus]|nr:hypothetical protein BLD50_00835 [Bacillus cereus]